MNDQEKLVSLEKDDLRKPLQIAQMQDMAFMGGVFIFPVIIFLVSKDSSLFFAIALSFVIFVLSLAFFLWLRKKNAGIREDYRAGKKVILTGTLKEKNRTGFGRSTMYYYRIEDRVFKMDPYVYENFEEGDSVQIEFAPLSLYVISIKKI